MCAEKFVSEEEIQPAVTVIMPAYKAEKYIGRAIDSVMEQTIDAGVELIIINDCSLDGTEKVVKERIDFYNRNKIPGRFIRYLKNTDNEGVAESRNQGIRRARGEYLAFLDSDDWWEPDKLEKQVSCMRQNPDTVLCATGRELMNPDGTSKGKIIRIPEKVSYKSLLFTNWIPCSAVIMKTEIAREFYMCHDELHEDYIMWLQVTRRYGSVIGLNEPLLKSRMSEGGKSRNKFKSAQMQYGTYRYIGIGRIKSLFLMISYMIYGVMKYL